MKVHEFSANELARAKKRLSQRYFPADSVRTHEQPVGALLGGQPASGKTGLFECVKQADSAHKFIEINGDEYRHYHPRAQEIDEEYGQDAPRYTQPFSNVLVEYLKAECLRLRCNFIIEGTMRTYAVIERTTREIKEAGFWCEAHVLAVHRRDSLLGIFERFETDKQRTGVGRFSAPAIHDEAYRQIPLNVQAAYDQQVCDRIVLYRRYATGHLTIGAKIDCLENKATPPDIPALFEQFRQPVQPNSFYHQHWLDIARLARQRGETNADYLGQIDGFIRQFAA